MFIDVTHQEEGEEVEVEHPSSPPSQRPSNQLFITGFHRIGDLQGWHIWLVYNFNLFVPPHFSRDSNFLEGSCKAWGGWKIEFHEKKHQECQHFSRRYHASIIPGGSCHWTHDKGLGILCLSRGSALEADWSPSGPHSLAASSSSLASSYPLLLQLLPLSHTFLFTLSQLNIGKSCLVAYGYLFLPYKPKSEEKASPWHLLDSWWLAWTQY